MSRSTRLLQLLRPYTPLFIVNLATTVLASVLDGIMFVLLIPFLRTLFGQEALPTTGGSAVERLLATVVGPLLAAGAPDTALRTVVLLMATPERVPSRPPPPRRGPPAAARRGCEGRAAA